MNKINNPFVITGYKGPEYFCDRKAEAKQITQLMLSGANITLFAIRRLGKTSLINHIFEPYKNSNKVACIYVDILATKDIYDFANLIASAVYNHFPPQKTIGKKIFQMFQGFSPTLTFDELSGAPSISLSIETKVQKEKTIGQIFQFLDQQKIKVVIAIDEFQQILEYPQKNTELLLRTYIQTLKNISFIFCGNNQKMMYEIFNSAKRPFFGSCTNLNLEYIPEEEYSKFIRKNFLDYKRKISNECINFICH